MNRRLKATLHKALSQHAAPPVLLDCYNQRLYHHHSPTITTRIQASCETYIMETTPPTNNTYRLSADGSISTVATLDTATPHDRCLQVAQLDYSFESSGRVYSVQGLAPTILTQSGGNHEPKIATVAKDSLIAEQQLLGWSRDSHGNIINRHPVSIANTQTAAKRDNTQNYVQETTPTTIRVRRLTEREIYRLMDVSEPDIDTLLATDLPRTAHAHLAGNSIVVNVLYHIFRKLLVDPQPEKGQQLKLF